MPAACAGSAATRRRSRCRSPSMELWHRIGDLVDDDCGFEATARCASRRTRRSSRRCASASARLALARLTHEELDRPRRAARAACRRSSRHCVGASSPTATAPPCPYRTTWAFRRKAEALGQRILRGHARRTSIARVGGAWSVETGARPPRGAGCSSTAPAPGPAALARAARRAGAARTHRADADDHRADAAFPRSGGRLRTGRHAVVQADSRTAPC